jgi:hypothetical protein
MLGFVAGFLSPAHAAAQRGSHNRLEKLSSSSGLPDGPCKIGLSAGLPSAWRNSARISASVGMSGTGLAAFSVFWCCREFVPNRLTHAQALAVEILPASSACFARTQASKELESNGGACFHFPILPQ